jgi:hypothetical protein
VFIAHCEESLFIGAPFGFSQKIRKFLLSSQDNSSFEDEKTGARLPAPAAMLANFFSFTVTVLEKGI